MSLTDSEPEDVAPAQTITASPLWWETAQEAHTSPLHKRCLQRGKR